MEIAKWYWVHVWEGRSVSYIRILKSCTLHIPHIAKYKSALESTRQPTLVAWRDGLSNLENASVPRLRPAFQSALYHAMKWKKKNKQWELTQTVLNTKVMKWWRRRIAFISWPEWRMNAVARQYYEWMLHPKIQSKKCELSTFKVPLQAYKKTKICQHSNHLFSKTLISDMNKTRCLQAESRTNRVWFPI